ncbi:MAG: aminotransferase class I/II-fold pyridoxal phosphate-dependent enzyme [Patescibacteria group bacterium]
MSKKPTYARNPYGCIVQPRKNGLYEGIAFAFPDCQTATDAFQGKERRYMYHGTNEGNPTVREFEKAIAMGEGAHAPKKYDALATASGMSAIDLLSRQLLLPGGEVASSPYVYGGIYNYFANYLPLMGAQCCFAEQPNDLNSWKQAIHERTAFLFLETPANPTSYVFDISVAVEASRWSGKPLVVDNTVPTHALQQPLKLGANITIVSCTKGINGKSNGQGGVIVGDTAFITALRDGWGATVRPTMDPRCAFEMLNGMKTLTKRMQHMSDNALKIAEWLNKHDKVKTVYYPFLDGVKWSKRIAEKQMTGGGPLLSFEIKGGKAFAWKWLDLIKKTSNRLTLAPHLGHSSSLLIHPATTTHWKVPTDIQAELGITDSLVRMSVGTETSNQLEEIINEMDQMFKQL